MLHPGAKLVIYSDIPFVSNGKKAGRGEAKCNNYSIRLLQKLMQLPQLFHQKLHFLLSRKDRKYNEAIC